MQPIAIEGCGPFYGLASDLPLLDSAIEHPASNIENSHPRLIAPLDPLIYDRRLTARLWNLDYTWEVYTPPAKRTRGYYALPVLVAMNSAVRSSSRRIAKTAVSALCPAASVAGTAYPRRWVNSRGFSG